jgi:alkanesulfonate monooxygenase SsuD/methylene tetrahydromethanopterin reductase-like flavin-dependent oxidoreductase (luciferase family)
MSATFGIQLCDQHPATDDMHERFLELVDQVRLARDIGFNTIVAGQHFLSDPLQMLQSMPVLSRLSAESGDMRFGPCILLMALTNPVQVAEEIATLDIMTGGRTFLGAALGYRDIEFDAFAVPRKQRVRRFETNLEVAGRLLAGERVTVDEPYCQLDDVAMSLKPVQQPRPPIWIGANSDKALRRAARLGDTWVINPHARLDTLTRQMDEIYRPALEEFGKPFPDEIPIRREIFVAEDRETAVREAAPWLLEKYKTYRSWGQDKALPEGDDFHEEAEELMRDRFILGSPEDCIREIDRYREQLGATEFIVRVQWPGMPNELALDNLRRIGESLIPHYSRPGN